MFSILKFLLALFTSFGTTVGLKAQSVPRRLRSNWRNKCSRAINGWLVSLAVALLLMSDVGFVTTTVQADTSKTLSVPYVNQKTAQQVLHNGLWTYCV